MCLPVVPRGPMATNASAADNFSLALANDRYDYAGRPETYIVPALFAVIFVVGTVGNGTLVLIFVRHRHMRNVPNIYILNLALGDLLVIISCVPFTSTVYTVRTATWCTTTVKNRKAPEWLHRRSRALSIHRRALVVVVPPLTGNAYRQRKIGRPWRRPTKQHLRGRVPRYGS